MNTGLPYHRGVILQKGRGVGSVLVHYLELYSL